MPFDFSRLLRSIESRARTVRGLSVSAAAFAAASMTAAAAVLVIRLVCGPFSHWLLLAFVLPPFAAAAIGYAVGRSNRPQLPHLLLRIDDSLGLNAQLSSLYELRQRGERSVFQQRIEAEVRDTGESWRGALPLERRTMLGGYAGVGCIALALGLAFAPLPDATQSPVVLLDEVDGRVHDSSVDATATLAAGGSAAPLTVRTGDSAGEEGSGPTLEAPGSDPSLDDVMRDLSWMTPDQAVLIPLSKDEVEELVRLQGDAMRALAELLEGIRDRLQSSADPALTEKERSALEEELDRGGLPPELDEALSELLNPPSSRSVQEVVEELIEQLGGTAERDSDASQDDARTPPRSTAMPAARESVDELLDQLGQASGEPEGEEGSEGLDSGSGGPQDTGASGPASSSSRATGTQTIEDPDEIGGTGGPGGPSDRLDEGDPGFIREEELAKVGSRGEFVGEFATEGVPIELAAHPDTGEPSFRVSYERIASILRDRGVPEGAIDIVRDYFNAITQGGS